MMAGLLYLGAGVGMFIVGVIKKKTGKGQKELPLTKSELPYTIGMVVWILPHLFSLCWDL